MKAFTTFLLVSALSAPAYAQSLFPDPALEEAVRHYVFEKRNTDEPLTPEDVKDISQVVARDKGIKDLSGIEHLKRVMLLDLSGNQISDITPLADLSLLQSLTLVNNQVSDVSPLEGLTRLQYIELSGNQVRDISALSELKAMSSLYLTGNQVTDISAVSGMPRLWSLYLEGNQIKDLSPLIGLKGVKRLALDDNQITDISPLIEMAQQDLDGKDRFARYWKVTLDGNSVPSAQVEKLEALKNAPYKTGSD